MIKDYLEKRTALAICFSVLLGVMLASVGFATSDMTQHLFFADHYSQGWFSLYESQIGGGLNMGTYPPLTYQLMALLSFIFSLRTSYWMLAMVSWITLSYFSTKILSDYLEIDRENEWFVYLLIFSGIGMLKAIFVHGQITTIVGLGFGSVAIYFLREALKTQRKVSFVLFALSYSLTGMAHHFSFLLVSLTLPFILIDERENAITKKFIRRFAPSIGLTALIISIGIMPFVKDLLLGGGVPTQEIAHFTRQSIFEMSHRRVKSTVYFVYGIGGMLFPFPLIAKSFRIDNLKKYLKLYVAALFFLILGLGPTTPLPEIVLPGIHHWVTYDRFSLFSSILFSGLLAGVICNYLDNSRLNSSRDHTLVAIAGLIVLINVLMVPMAHQLAHGDSVETPNEHRDDMTAYMVDFLQNSSPDYRYQTLGYGVPIAQLYLQTDTPTLDSWYFSGRQKKWLRESGIGDIDSVNKESLDLFMSHATEDSVKYIFTMNPKDGLNYNQIMQNYSWEKRNVKQFGERKLFVWENPESVEPLTHREEEKSIINYIWGIVPVTVFFIWIGGLASLRRF